MNTDIRQTSEYAKYMQSLGWAVKKINNIYCYIKKLPLLGNFVKIQRTAGSDPAELWDILQKHKPFQIVLEPMTEIDMTGFELAKSPYLPSKTIEIDLRKSEQKLLLDMHSKTRYNIKVAQKNDLTIEISKDIVSFVNLWSRQREGLLTFLYSQKNDIGKFFKAFNQKADLLIAKKDDKLLAGILMPRTNDKAYYMYAASTTLGKKLHAPTLLTWEAIKLAKKRGCKVFDFEGIYDHRFPIKSWEGFSKFKRTFGGKKVEYPGCFTKTNFLNIFK